MNTKGREILERPVFTKLLFSQCWEDPLVGAEALQVSPGDVVVSVTSGGCNSLALAMARPSRIISVDLNDAQNWLLELKIAGACSLTHGEYLEFLGVRPSRRRAAMYRTCRGELSPGARAFWDERVRTIKKGVLQAGRYERYLGVFRRILKLVQGGRKIRRLFECQTLQAQRRFYEDQWNTRRWRLFFRIFFSRFVLGRGGLDPKCFSFVDGIDDFGEHFRRLARHVLVDLPIRENYFLAQICLGRYLNEQALPPYLQAENFAALRENVRCIEPVTAKVGDVLADLPDRSVNAFNLSNVFEWVSPGVFEEMLREIHRVAAPAGRLCYWNLLVRRSHPASLDGLFAPENELAARLLHEDRSFVYSNFEVASVTKTTAREGENDDSETETEVPGALVDIGRALLCHAGGTEHRPG